jgi:hypothetical protein
MVSLAPGTPDAANEGRVNRLRRRVLPWSDLLRRVFLVDVLVCQKCFGPMTVVAYLTDPAVVGKILGHRPCDRFRRRIDTALSSLGIPCARPLAVTLACRSRPARAMARAA